MVYLSNGIAMITIVSWQVPYKYHFDAHQKVKVVHSSISKSNYECIPKSVAHTQVCVFLSVHKGKGGAPQSLVPGPFWVRGGGTPVSGPRPSAVRSQNRAISWPDCGSPSPPGLEDWDTPSPFSQDWGIPSPLPGKDKLRRGWYASCGFP